ncbi:hypothetical protein [Isobaculum melis]|uniref:Uncharacterized protein n=1 Tax=Isobaculum melis TaxID=142588 RepID=A0A1H9T364_9LACT|nr:hypothetical protein [Isobaculum melis]SER91702.1 hypothetical protein SAMN04488559_110100 [Isobaculum melis]
MNKFNRAFFSAILLFLLSQLLLVKFSGSLVDFFSGLTTGLLIVASLHRITHKSSSKS